MSQDVHVSDVGTVYRIPLFDNDLDLVNFNPSSAAERKIIWQMPGVGVVERDATAEQVEIDGANVWCLVYTVVTADASEFHVQKGPIKMQGRIVLADGREWTTSLIVRDYRRRALKVMPVLDDV